MKLRSYFNPTRDSNLMQTAQIRLATDSAPAAPFVLLGDLTHEAQDNLSGAQKLPINHAIYSHVQELLYTKHGIQDMQKIKLTNAGTFVLPTGFSISHTNTYVKPGEVIKVDFAILPANATKDGYFMVIENPSLITVVKNGGTDGKWEVKFKGDGETILTFGVVNNPTLAAMLPIQAWTTTRKP